MTQPSRAASPKDAYKKLSGSPSAMIILAAGKGKRMRSSKPKVLHAVAGLSLLGHVMRTALALEPQKVITIVGHGGDAVRAEATTRAPGSVVVLQEQQHGTGHATQQAKPILCGFSGDVFVLFGDTPLITETILRRMQEARRGGAGVVVLGFETDQPGGYGRLVTSGDGALDRIVEARDATPEEQKITLCNSGVMCVDGARLFAWLDRINAQNAQGEYYLTDIVEVARKEGACAAIVQCDPIEVLGVNSRVELAEAEAAFQKRARRAALMNGATMIAPETVWLAHDTKLAEDIIIEPNVFFGPGVTIGTGAHIRSNCHLEGCAIAQNVIVGPFARLRPGTELQSGSRVGNFIEMKNTVLGTGSKAMHLTYLGDTHVGEDANIGAGTITCNYDGSSKHKTAIGSGAFIGSNAALVAPIRIGERATVGAGSTVTVDVPPDALAIGRARQTTRAGLAKRLRETLHAAKNTPAVSQRSVKPISAEAETAAVNTDQKSAHVESADKAE